MSDLNIYQRINAVMKEVDYVKKDKSVSGGGASYKAVTHDQVISVIRKSIVDHGIVILTEQTDGEIIIKRDIATEVKMHLYAGLYTIKFVNMDKPADLLSVTVQAHAADNGDKAPGKCMTYAVKMAILKVFLLETGEDDESRTAEPEPDVPQKQAITDARMDKAIEKIKAGEYTLAKLLETFMLTDEQIDRLADILREAQ